MIQTAHRDGPFNLFDKGLVYIRMCRGKVGGISKLS